MSNEITQPQYNSLKDAIYHAFMNIKLYDSEGEPVEMGMGEMGEAEDAAGRLVDEWMEGNGITIENDSIPATITPTPIERTVNGIVWQIFTTYEAADNETCNAQAFEYMIDKVKEYWVNKDNGAVIVCLLDGNFFTDVYENECTGTFDEVVTFLNNELN